MNWDELRKEYESSTITLNALAEKYDIKIGTLKSRKSREGWTRGPTKKDATKRKKVASPIKKDATKKIAETLMENNELDEAEKEFCLQYIKYFNATKAYQKVYGGNYGSCKTLGSRMLTKVHVKNEINRLQKEQAENLLLDSNAVLQKYIDIAFSDITDFVEFGREEVTDDLGNPYEVNRVKFRQSSDVDGTLITEIKQGKDGVSVKLADKMKALDFLSKYTDLLSENERKKLQEEKTKMEIEKTKADIARIKGEEDETEDDGFIDALKTETEEVWEDDDET